MSYQPPPTTTPPPPPTFWQRYGRWIAGIGVVLAAIGGIIQLIGAFTLPACDARRSTDTVRNIFKDRKVELTRLFDIKTVTSTNEEKTCVAQIDTSTERVTINYRVFWKGWTVLVQITSVTNRTK